MHAGRFVRRRGDGRGGRGGRGREALCEIHQSVYNTNTVAIAGTATSRCLRTTGCRRRRARLHGTGAKVTAAQVRARCHSLQPDCRSQLRSPLLSSAALYCPLLFSTVLYCPALPPSCAGRWFVVHTAPAGQYRLETRTP
eukprot:7948554-Pyramimonas_sp.AAC.3